MTANMLLVGGGEPVAFWTGQDWTGLGRAEAIREYCLWVVGAAFQSRLLIMNSCGVGIRIECLKCLICYCDVINFSGLLSEADIVILLH
jgi:hypothetical protein